MSTFSLNTFKLDLKQMEWRATAAATAETVILPGGLHKRWRTVRVKPKCHHLNTIALRLAHILKVYEIIHAERVSHFICLIAQNSRLTYKLSFPEGLVSNYNFCLGEEKSGMRGKPGGLRGNDLAPIPKDRSSIKRRGSFLNVRTG